MPTREKQFIVVMFVDREGFGFNEHTLPPLVTLMDTVSPDYRQWDHSGVSGYFLSSNSAAARVQKVIEAAERLRDSDDRFADLGIGSAKGSMIVELTWLGRLKRDKIPLGHAASEAFRAAKA